MNLSELFIRRPVTTVLLNAAIVLAGGERIVLEGRQNVRPGNLVVERSAPAASAGSSPVRPASAP